MTLISVFICLFKIFLYAWDVLTFPVYLMLQKPWQVRHLLKRTRSRVVAQDGTEITVRSKAVTNKIVDEMKACPIDINTMDRLFSYSCNKYQRKKCLGTREVLGETSEKQADGKMFVKLQLGEYKWMNYTEVNLKAEQMGRGLRELGVHPKDKVVLYANTSAEWIISSMAAFKHSIGVVTIYTNLGEDGVEHGISQTDANTVVVSQELLPTLQNVLLKCSSVKNVIIIPTHNPQPTPAPTTRVTYYKMNDVISMGMTSSIPASPPDPMDTAIIMYTSGSTGVPKGVVLTHGNLIYSLFSLIPTLTLGMLPFKDDDIYMALLPLAHVLELLAENIMMVVGIPIGYSSPKTFTDSGTALAKGCKGDASILKPTLVAVVPLVLDKVYKGIKSKVAARGPFFEQLIRACYKYRLRWIKNGYDTPIMNKLIFNKFKMAVGGNLRFLFSGGAPLAPDTHDYCRTMLGIALLQGYGLTETCATACIPDAYDLSTGCVGGPPQGVDIKLVNWEEGNYKVTDPEGPRGEIYIGGGNVAKEYYKMPEKTEEDFFKQNGKRWFKTGDIGQLMDDGSIKIVDRKKDLVKLQGGEYVSLGKVESMIKNHPAVENICVCAEPQKNFCVALIVPAQEHMEILANQLQLDASREELCSNAEIRAEYLKIMDQHGKAQRLEKFEIPKAVFLVCEPWTPESGLLTAAMKLKRKPLSETYCEEIMAMYDSNNNQSNLKSKNRG